MPYGAGRARRTEAKRLVKLYDASDDRAEVEGSGSGVRCSDEESETSAPTKKQILTELQALLEDINDTEIDSQILNGTLFSWLHSWKMECGRLVKLLL